MQLQYGWIHRVLVLLVAGVFCGNVYGQINVTIDTSPEGRKQIIDGFGAHQGSGDREAAWWQELYFDDMKATIYRVDLTPKFKSPYSDNEYNSPSYGQPGPDGNNVREYTNAEDYTRMFNGRRAQIAVMGPDIRKNIEYYQFERDGAIEAAMARAGQMDDFKLVGSVWSPAPWVKISSGNTYPGSGDPAWPKAGAKWPFIWLGNFAGGMLDVSGMPLEIFNDAPLGGTGPTSALTQFARGIASYLLGYQEHHGVKFYAISIQNELNFEEFYNSMTYPLSSMYITALKTVRDELDKYDELKDIKIMGPEDLMGGDVWGMWQYGGGENTIHKNLQYLQNIAKDPVATEALDFFAIHGYAADGVSAGGANPVLWDWWANGWDQSPVPGPIPNNVKGFTEFGKKSWMTETSGEKDGWLVYPESWQCDGPAECQFPSQGAFSIALKIHQALTVGQQSAWIYWTFSDGSGSRVSDFGLTNNWQRENASKYVAMKHFARYIRPGMQRVAVQSGSATMNVSTYVGDETGALTIVLVNSDPNAQTVTITMPAEPRNLTSFETVTSQNGSLWQESETAVADGKVSVTVPGYGVVTLAGVGSAITATEDEAELPSTAVLEQNYPNPFSTSTSIRYTLAEPSTVTLTVFDVTGRTVAVLVDEVRAAGTYTAEFDARDLPSGVYYCRLEAAGQRLHKTLVVTK